MTVASQGIGHLTARGTIRHVTEETAQVKIRERSGTVPDKMTTLGIILKVPKTDHPVSVNKNSDNYILRSSCLTVADLQIIGLAETHLVGNDNIDFDGYHWFGNNRKLHVNAKVGSGGVGF